MNANSTNPAAIWQGRLAIEFVVSAVVIASTNITFTVRSVNYGGQA